MAVAPLVGAWIEICDDNELLTMLEVAPLVGAWIEIPVKKEKAAPSVVAPLVGAWIEIKSPLPGTHGFALSLLL